MLVFLRAMVRTRRRALRLPVADTSNNSLQKAWFERHSYRITQQGFIHWTRLPVHFLTAASFFFQYIVAHEMYVIASPMIYYMQVGGESTSEGEDMLCRLPLVFLEIWFEFSMRLVLTSLDCAGFAG